MYFYITEVMVVIGIIIIIIIIIITASTPPFEIDPYPSGQGLC